MGENSPGTGCEHTSLLINLHLHIHVDGEDDDVADNIQGSYSHEDVGIFEGDFLARLHHHKHDNEVGTAFTDYENVRRWLSSIGSDSDTPTYI